MFQRLREETRTQHESIENTLDLFQRVRSLDKYRRLLERFYGFYVPLEARLDSLDLGEKCELDFSLRKKVPLLLNDLRFLGATSEEMSQLPLAPRDTLPAIDTPEEALGVLYVMEGSTLGGQIISRHFRSELAVPEQALTFFKSYGAEVGHFWRDLRDASEIFVGTQPNPEESARVVLESAKATFHAFEEWNRSEI